MLRKIGRWLVFGTLWVLKWVFVLVAVLVEAVCRQLWKVIPIRDPVRLTVSNRGTKPHEVTVRIHDGTTTKDPVVYEERIAVPPGEPMEYDERFGGGSGPETSEEEAIEAGEWDPEDRPVRPTRVRRTGVVERVGRYHVFAELDDGTTDEYYLSPSDTPITNTSMPGLAVTIEGDLGHFGVVGTGGPRNTARFPDVADGSLGTANSKDPDGGVTLSLPSECSRGPGRSICPRTWDSAGRGPRQDRGSYRPVGASHRRGTTRT